MANNNSGTVSVISTASNTLIQTVTVGSQPRGIEVTPDNSTVYVANRGSDTVSVINANTYAVTTINVGNEPAGLV